MKIQEGEIHKLAQVLGPTSNTIIPQKWIDNNTSLHQAHLERISDFLLPGPGVWWQNTPAGIEFFDGYHSPSEHAEGPEIHHVRSASLSDIDLYLHNKWEECCNGKVHLPANYIRQYQSDGSLSNITTCQEPCSSANADLLHLESQQIPSLGTPQSMSTTQVHVQVHVTPQTSAAQVTSQTSAAQITPRLTSAAQVTSQTSAVQVTSQTSAAQVTSQTNAAQVTLVPMNVTLNSTLAKTMSQILPVDTTLKRFDVLRSKVKQAMALTSYEHRHLQILSEKLKTCLIAKHKELNSAIKTLERECKQPQRIIKLSHQLNIVRRVLKHEWKIDTVLSS